MRGWLDYWQAVRARIVWDRSVLRGTWVVLWLQMKGRIARMGRPTRAHIAYFPQPAGPWYTLPLTLLHTGIRTTRDVRRADFVMIFDDRTESAPELPETDAVLLNARATDISKTQVARIFDEVFGYSLDRDPTTTSGWMVEKSDINGVHDGRSVQGPVSAPRPGHVYQKLIDSQVRDGVTEDLRCICVKGVVAQVFRKKKAVRDRFAARYLETTLQEASRVFSDEERKSIAQFCELIGLDFGSIDVLRDHRGDGQIYIVDVNKTCMPVLSMPVTELETGLKTVAQCLVKEIALEL